MGDDRVPCEKGHQAQNKHDEAPDVNETTWCKYRSSIILNTVSQRPMTYGWRFVMGCAHVMIFMGSGLCIQSSSSGPVIISPHSPEAPDPTSANFALLSRLAELTLNLAGGKRRSVGFVEDAEGPYC